MLCKDCVLRIESLDPHPFFRPSPPLYRLLDADLICIWTKFSFSWMNISHFWQKIKIKNPTITETYVPSSLFQTQTNQQIMSSPHLLATFVIIYLYIINVFHENFRRQQCFPWNITYRWWYVIFLWSWRKVVWF